ncbi:MAG: ABC transporter permease subunit [Planctomycetota bacterium]
MTTETAAKANRSSKQTALALCMKFGFVLLTAMIALATWQVLADRLDSAALLPRPAEVWEAANEYQEKLVKAWCFTGMAAAAGLVSAVCIGSLISVAFSQSKLIRLAFFPYVVFLQTVPIVAIAPLLIIWSGYEFRTVVIVTVIVCLFPIVNNVTAGLMAIDRQLSDLFSLYGAGRAWRLMRLQLPSCIPSSVIGTKTSSGLAVIGAIVAEFFVGSGSSEYDGLGTLMTLWQGQLRTAPLIAALFASTLLGLALYATVELLSKTLLRRWTR